MPLWQLLEYVEVLMEYYGIRHEGFTIPTLIRRLEILMNIRKQEANANGK